MENVKEVAPVIAGIAKGVAVAGKAAAKAAAVGAKAAAKGSKVAAKAGAKAAKGTAKAAKTGAKATGDAAKGASKTNKPVARKLTTRRNVKNPKYRKFEKDDKGNIVKGKKFDKKLYDQDGNKKTQGYMSNIEGPTDSRSTTHSGEMRQSRKETDAREKRVQDTAQSIKQGVKKTAQAAGDAADYARKKAKDGVRSYTGAFGTSSFSKESKKITFKDYLNKL